MTKRKKTDFAFESSYDLQGPKEQERAFHFFGSNALEWFTDTDVNKVYSFFEKQGYFFNLWFIPVHTKTGYQINQAAPQIDGAHWLGSYHPKTK